jgi:hypothetical protein
MESKEARLKRLEKQREERVLGKGKNSILVAEVYRPYYSFALFNSHVMDRHNALKSL